MANPVSPHLQIYKLPLSAILSISHRISGFINFIGLLLVIWHLFFLFYLPNSILSSLSEFFFYSYFSKIFFVIFSASLYFHLCTGVRHLIWNIGKGFSLSLVHITNYIVITSSIFLFIVTWSFILIFN
jgi:succinate dehydrogenase / fumarate reductase cytochrome b subunit